jgi:hypothetical protein
VNTQRLPTNLTVVHRLSTAPIQPLPQVRAIERVASVQAARSSEQPVHTRSASIRTPRPPRPAGHALGSQHQGRREQQRTTLSPGKRGFSTAEGPRLWVTHAQLTAFVASCGKHPHSDRHSTASISRRCPQPPRAEAQPHPENPRDLNASLGPVCQRWNETVSCQRYPH